MHTFYKNISVSNNECCHQYQLLLSQSASVMGIHPEGYNFFKQMAVASSIFTLDGVVQLFWAAFDMPMTMVPLKVALGWDKSDFWVFQKIIMGIHLTPTCVIWAFWANKE